MTDERRALVLLTPAQVQSMIEGGHGPDILAVQSVNPYTGRISERGRRVPGAVDAEAYSDVCGPPSLAGGQRPVPDIATLQANARRWGLRRDRTVVVYDDDRNMTAARAWWVLRWAGLPDVRVLDGGLPAWLAAGMPVAHAPGRPAPSMIEHSPGHMPELDAGACATLARNGVLLDARNAPRQASRPAVISPARAAFRRMTISPIPGRSPTTRRWRRSIAVSAPMAAPRSASIAGPGCRRP